MTITCAVETIADSIAALSITGVTVKDIDQIPDAATMLCPILIPQPNGFMTDLDVSFESFGSNGTAKINIEYNLHYVFLYSEAGSGLNAFAPYAGLVGKIADIIEKITSNDAITGLVDIKLGSLGDIGIISDPAGNNYWGALFSLRVLEYAQ